MSICFGSVFTLSYGKTRSWLVFPSALHQSNLTANCGYITMIKRELTKHTFKLYKGQVDRIARLHPNMPVSGVLRQLIDAYCHKRESMETHVELDIDIEVDFDE
jgi:hypothetical protein